MLPRAARTWIDTNWPYAGLTAGLFLLAILPLLWRAWPLTLLVVFLQLPIYMAHQVEEHHHDRFRTFVNDHLAHGRNALTTPAVVFINLVGVGLIAIYLALVNALAHVAVAILLRAYNPGLITAILLLLPAGSIGWWIIVHNDHPSLSAHLQIAGLVILAHAAILLYVRYRIHQLDSSAAV
jgi:hypothetical protein